MHSFPEYTKYSPSRRAFVITPERSGCFHRFFDTSPFSPSGRYVALVQAPFEDRVNLPGEKAGIVVVDLETGAEAEVAQTAGWEFQMGANLQWGADDETLLYNDVDTDNWSSHGVRLEWRSGEQTTFARGIYHASPDGRSVAVTNPAAMRRTQKGYGVVIPDELVPVNQGLPDDDGLFVTDLESGKTELVASIRRIVMDAVPREERADYEAMQNYAFHCKWNPQGDRLMVTLRRKLADQPEPFGVRDHSQMWFDIFTCRPDGSDMHRSVPWTEWKKGGHHTTFTPDGRHLSMNVALHGRGTGMVLMQVKLDVNERPDLRPSTVADAYNPIRWIDFQAGSEEQILWIPTATPHQATDSVLRVDPHPAWSRDWKMAMVNAWMDGTRRPVVIVME